MRLAATALAFAGLLTTGGLAEAAPEAFRFDTSHTRVMFFTLHGFGASRQLGLFRTLYGSFVLDSADLSKSRVDVELDAASLTMFEPTLDEQLKSKLFFDVATYPLITFRSTGARRTGPSTGVLVGDLTMHGVTRAVSLDVTLNALGDHPFYKVRRAGFSAKGRLKRSDFGLGAFIPSVGDDIQIELEVEGYPPGWQAPGVTPAPEKANLPACPKPASGGAATSC